jgi:urease accessory protein
LLAEHKTEFVVRDAKPGASLSLRFGARKSDGERVMQVLRQDPPWRVVRSFRLSNDASLIHLHNLSGGVLSGDNLMLAVEVGSGAHVQMTSTGATRIYRHRADRVDALSSMQANVRSHALFEYLPDQIIPYAGSRFHQDVEIDLDSDDAGLFWWETVTPGRTASGERFAFDRLSLRTHLTCEGKLFSLDQFVLEPGRMAQADMLGGFDCCSTFYICRSGLADHRWAELEEMLNEEAERFPSAEMRWGASRLMAHGIMMRGVGFHASQMLAALVVFWRLAKMYLYGQHAVIPRKIH